MAEHVLKNAYIMINSVDLTDHLIEATPNYGAELFDNTKFTATTTTRSQKAGLLNWSITFTFFQDYASGQVDATLFPLVGAAAFAIVYKPDGSTTSVTNPKFTGNAVIESYVPFAGKVGDDAMCTVTLKNAGTLTRATAD